MGKLILVTGGVRSGKSTYAEKLVMKSARVRYIATAVPFDDEMRARIKKHRDSRPAGWETIEAYRDLARYFANADAVLLDCMTIMVTNLMMDCSVDWDNPTPEQADEAESIVRAEIEKTLAAARAFDGTSVFVTNEVGMGLVPSFPFGRVFRDVAGRMNRLAADEADEVWLLVSGQPLRIKEKR